MSKLKQREVIMKIVTICYKRLLSFSFVAILISTLFTVSKVETTTSTSTQQRIGNMLVYEELMNKTKEEDVEVKLPNKKDVDKVKSTKKEQHSKDKISKKKIKSKKAKNEDGKVKKDIISKEWPVTKDQLKDYFGYVPEEWELEYFEACVMAECGHEPEEGIKAVCDCIGYVRTNTDDRFPDTIYDVLTQKNQFSTWSNGAIKRCLGNVSEEVHDICVYQIENGATYDAAFFTAGRYNRYSKPGFVIGNHYFGY